MKLLFIIFFVSLTLGQIGAIPLGTSTTLYAHDIVLTVILFAALIAKKKPSAKPKLWLPIVSFVGAGLLSLLVNISRFSLPVLGQSSLYLVRWTLYAGLYWIVLEDFVPVIFWLRGLYLAGVGLAAFGLIQYVWYPYLRNLSYLGWDPHLYRVFSTLFDPNFLGLIFVFTLFIGVYLWGKGKYRMIIGMGEVLTGVAFLLTYSRSGYLALVVALTVLLGFIKKWSVLGGLIGLLAAGIVLLPRPGGEGVNIMRTVSTAARFGNWERGLVLIRQSPVFGYGFNTLRSVQRTKGWIDESQGISRAGAGLDNSFEFVWATTGVVGLAAYGWLLGSMYALGLQRITKGKYHLLAIMYIALGIGMVVQSLFLNSLFYPWILLWWWIMTGALERAG